MSIDVQLSSFYQFDRNAFELSIVNIHLIILFNFVLEFFQKETKVDHLFDVLIFVFFSHLFFKDLSISINIWTKDFHELCNEFNIVIKEFNSPFFPDDFIFATLFLETFKKLYDIMFIEMQSLWKFRSEHRHHVSNCYKHDKRRWHVRNINKKRVSRW